MSTKELPPLPAPARSVVYNESKGYTFDAYTATQMRDYALAAIAQPAAEPPYVQAFWLAAVDAAEAVAKSGDGRAFCAAVDRLTEAILHPPQPAAPDARPYIDSTPHLNVGNSAFESWFQAQPFATQPGIKQISRDSYAAGMGDPLVVAAPDAQPEPCTEPGCFCHVFTDNPASKSVQKRLAVQRADAQPVAWLGGDGHPHHISAVQTATERRIYGTWVPLYAAAQAAQPLPPYRVSEILVDAGYDRATPEATADFINGLRHGEAAHGITAAPPEKPAPQPLSAVTDDAMSGWLYSRRHWIDRTAQVAPEKVYELGFRDAEKHHGIAAAPTTGE